MFHLLIFHECQNVKTDYILEIQTMVYIVCTLGLFNRFYYSFFFVVHILEFYTSCDVALVLQVINLSVLSLLFFLTMCTA
jgi:hypothetical protein